MKRADFWAEQPKILAEDAGAIRARRVLDKLIREENRGGAAHGAVPELAEAG